MTGQLLVVLFFVGMLTAAAVDHFAGPIEQAPLPALLAFKAGVLLGFGCVALLFVGACRDFTPWWTRIFPTLAALFLFVELAYFGLVIGVTLPFRQTLDGLFGSFGGISVVCLFLSLPVGLIAVLRRTR